MENIWRMGTGIFHILLNAMAALMAGCKRVCKTGDGKKIFYPLLLVFGLITVVSQPLHADGLDTWHWRNPLPQGNYLSSVTYGNATFVAVGNRGTILTSPDGVTWTTRTSGRMIPSLESPMAMPHLWRWETLSLPHPTV